MSAAVPNHRRTKPGGIKPGAPSNGVSGPTSQIPGLSQSADDSAPVERISGRRVGIFETDSEYVKLAKQGGQKGLLSHDVDFEAKPGKPYNPPEWFGGEKSGSNATSPDGQLGTARQPLAAPFGTDNSSTWERETDSFTHAKEKLSPDSTIQDMEGLSITDTNKYKRTSYDKKAPPVSMSKLLSFGYVEDEKKSPDDDDASSVTSEQTSTVATEDVDDLE
ncbi:uncharacterized protein C7orf57 homolog [Centroberyx gerrardi]|uniref:uncharacterized protein C7orf57 homolog n=1 Tax=Centroberyx gerrardi TaxID=166262 RepID=UPI003AAC34B7